MSVRRVVLIRCIADEFELVSAQVATNLRAKKVQEAVDRKNRICNVVVLKGNS